MSKPSLSHLTKNYSLIQPNYCPWLVSYPSHPALAELRKEAAVEEAEEEEVDLVAVHQVVVEDLAEADLDEEAAVDLGHGVAVEASEGEEEEIVVDVAAVSVVEEADINLFCFFSHLCCSDILNI